MHVHNPSRLFRMYRFVPTKAQKYTQTRMYIAVRAHALSHACPAQCKHARNSTCTRTHHHTRSRKCYHVLSSTCVDPRSKTIEIPCRGIRFARIDVELHCRGITTTSCIFAALSGEGRQLLHFNGLSSAWQLCSKQEAAAVLTVHKSELICKLCLNCFSSHV